MLPPDVDAPAAVDLLTFARVEVEAGDIEPWAAMLAAIHEAGDFDREQALWACKLYNAFDCFDSAFGVMGRWGSVEAWADDPSRGDVAEFPCTQERRNLRGGRVITHMWSYAGWLNRQAQEPVLRWAIVGDDPGRDFDRLTTWMRHVWGVGRQSAFEWAEFCAKVCGFPVDASHGQLWESEGPRRSIERLWDRKAPSSGWLDERATELRQWLADEGVPLAWVDFETVICDFNVMRDGRYYPGRHLAALREEVDGAAPEWRPALERAWEVVVPPEWQGIAPGIVKAHLPTYRDEGWIRCQP